MSKRGLIRLFGLGLSILGLFIFSFSSLNLTGFAVYSGLPTFVNIFYLTIGVSFLLGGAVLFVSFKDPIQQRLEEMESDSPSPSLQEPLPRNASEGLRFWLRRNFGGLRREQVPQDPKKFYGHVNYVGTEPFGWKNKNNRAEVMKEIEFLQKEYRSLLNKPLSLDELYKRNKNLPKERQIWSEREAAEKIEALYESIGQKFKRKIYEGYQAKLAKKELAKRFKEWGSTAEEFENMIDYVHRQGDRGETIGRWVNQDAAREHIKLEELLEIYEKNAQFVPVSKFSQKYQRTIVHGIPIDAHSNYGMRIRNNPVMQRDIPGGNNPENWTPDFFLKIILDNKPALSASSISSSSSSEELYSPIGVILKEGHIYAASDVDMASRPIRGTKLRLPGHDTAPSSAEEIESRALKSPMRLSGKGYYGELVVAKPEVKGLYIVENGKSRQQFMIGGYEKYYGMMKELSSKYNLPLYVHREGTGFIPLEQYESQIREKMGEKDLRGRSRINSRDKDVALRS